MVTSEITGANEWKRRRRKKSLKSRLKGKIATQETIDTQ